MINTTSYSQEPLPKASHSPYDTCSSFKSRNVKRDVIQSISMYNTKSLNPGTYNSNLDVPAESLMRLLRIVPACARLLDLVFSRV